MASVLFTSESSSGGVVERDFSVGDIPGVLWTPDTAAADVPLVLMGHNAGMHKRAPGIVARARHFAGTLGFAVAAIDAPGHGKRSRIAEDEDRVAALQQARSLGQPMTAIIVEHHSSLAQRAVPEWQATMDALLELPEIGTQAPVGFSGLTLGTVTGLLLAATDDRVTAATFGAVPVSPELLDVATKVTLPVELLAYWDDEQIDRESGLALFDALASREKTLHANPGRHNQIPEHEIESAGRFFVRHLTRAMTTA